jgi:uncharacterized membrane protein YfcA
MPKINIEEFYHDKILKMSTFEFLFALIGGGFAAGFIDALAGGGGLISLPVLFWVGLPPATALGTNKLQACLGEATTMLHFIKHRHLDLREIKFGMAIIFIFGIVGALTVQYIHPDLLYKIMPWILLSVLMYLLFMPYLTRLQLKVPMNTLPFYLIIGILIGFYNGFFGPGTGSFLVFAYLVLMCFTMQKAAIYSKPLNLVANVAALSLFIIKGKVAYLPALVMGAGQMVGAKVGAHLVILKGSKLIRPLFLIVVGLVTIKMFYHVYG